ncbi:MAG TPA: hypothetical protein VGE08_08510 [Steroidobacter sp.]|uniref:hypothetical protein n=1 Tax=Steroidobacter sp. TaxID=1978227 RepID=UPI002ED7B752
MSDITLTDEERCEAADQLHEPSGMDESLIEQLVRGTSWATQAELTENEHGEI